MTFAIENGNYSGIVTNCLDVGTDLQAGRQPVAGLSSVPLEVSEAKFALLAVC